MDTTGSERGTGGGPPQVVRMFPDYADTVLWFGGPIPYPDSGLSASLIRDLQAWEQSYYDALTPDFEWKSASAADDFSAEGATLAQRLAGELGSGY